MKVDLHSHTTASDGILSPMELYQRACTQKIDLLAITDHDSIAAHLFLKPYDLKGLRLISGIELSTTWNGLEIHIVGLNFPLDHPNLQHIINHQTNARQQRSKLIATALSKRLSHRHIKPDKLLQEVIDISQKRQNKSNDGFSLSSEHIPIGRPHFAQWLLNNQYVNNIQAAFDHYLSNQHLGNTKQFWPQTSQAVAWLKSIGGTAIIAHPHRYKLTLTKLKKLIHEFKLAGGHALEIAGCNTTPEQINTLCSLAQEFQLTGSIGSDFHSPENSWIELGKLPIFPKTLQPVWQHW